MSDAAAQHGLVIVGAGLAGVRTAGELRRGGYTGPITLVGDETRLPYDHPPLTKEVLRGERDDSPLERAEFYEGNDITLRLGSAAQHVDTGQRTVTLADRTVLGYDQLVIATGLVPRRIPTFPDLDGIGVLRSFDDCLALRRRAKTARRAVVIGAGFIGCEVASSLRILGVDVALVEPQPVPLASVLGEQVGALIARLHRAGGVDVRTGVGVAQLRGTDRVETAVLTDGTELDTDLVVVAVGSRPATGWLAGSGIELGDGVLCDAVGRTSAAGVWALGDVALWRGRPGRQARVEHWSNAIAQAEAMVPVMLGREPDADVWVPYFWSDQYDLKIQCLGEPEPTDTVHLVSDNGHKFLAYYERDGVLAGVVGAGMSGRVMSTRPKIVDRVPISEALPAPP